MKQSATLALPPVLFHSQNIQFGSWGWVNSFRFFFLLCFVTVVAFGRRVCGESSGKTIKWTHASTARNETSPKLVKIEKMLPKSACGKKWCVTFFLLLDSNANGCVRLVCNFCSINMILWIPNERVFLPTFFYTSLFVYLFILFGYWWYRCRRRRRRQRRHRSSSVIFACSVKNMDLLLASRTVSHSFAQHDCVGGSCSKAQTKSARCLPIHRLRACHLFLCSVVCDSRSHTVRVCWLLWLFQTKWRTNAFTSIHTHNTDGYLLVFCGVTENSPFSSPRTVTATTRNDNARTNGFTFFLLLLFASRVLVSFYF